MANQPTATPLSPAAQAVLDAFSNASDGEYIEGVWVVYERTMLAAALRVVADQVVPDGPKPSANSEFHLHHWTQSWDQYYQRQQTRAELLAIAAELKAQP